MFCPNCGGKVPEGAGFCEECGTPVQRYDVPEGFVLDDGSGLYYRTDYDHDGRVIGTTWFNCVSGEYEQTKAEQPQPAVQPVEQPQPEPQPVEPTPEPIPVEQPIELPTELLTDPQPTAPTVPDGFAYDSTSGLYYQETREFDEQTGAPMRVITWFYPDSGRYERVPYPAEVQQYAAQQAQPQQKQKKAKKVKQPKPERAQKSGSKKTVIIIIIAAVLVVAALAVVAYIMEWPPFADMGSGNPRVSDRDRDDDDDDDDDKDKDKDNEDDEDDGDTDGEDEGDDGAETPDASDPAPEDTTTPTQTPSVSTLVPYGSITTLTDFQLGLSSLASGKLSADEAEELSADLEGFLLRNLDFLVAMEMITEDDMVALQEAIEAGGFITGGGTSAPTETPAVPESPDVIESQQLPADVLLWGECDIDATASSSLAPSKNYNYKASNVLDGNSTTAWVEGASGHGVDEWIMLSTSSEANALLSVMSIRNGYQRTDTTYTTNARVKDIKVEFTDGTCIYYTLADSKDWQNIPIPDNTVTRTVKVYILSVYAGTHYEDTCISDISLG